MKSDRMYNTYLQDMLDACVKAATKLHGRFFVRGE